MNRRFDAGDLVMLPRLDASSAVAVSEALLTLVKEEEDVPETIEDAGKRLKKAVAVLSEAARARFELATASEETKVEAHRAAASAFKASYDFLKSWAELPEEKGGEKTKLAKRLLAAL